MLKQYLYILILTYLITSCGMGDSVKRGLSGSKKLSTDEFLVQKKDPLILPPDFEDLPIPDQIKNEELEKETLVFKNITKGEKTTSTPSSTEKLILNKIKTK
jgi:hypothetical protein